MAKKTKKKLNLKNLGYLGLSLVSLTLVVIFRNDLTFLWSRVGKSQPITISTVLILDKSNQNITKLKDGSTTNINPYYLIGTTTTKDGKTEEMKILDVPAGKYPLVGVNFGNESKKRKDSNIGEVKTYLIGFLENGKLQINRAKIIAQINSFKEQKDDTVFYAITIINNKEEKPLPEDYVRNNMPEDKSIRHIVISDNVISGIDRIQVKK